MKNKAPTNANRASPTQPIQKLLIDARCGSVLVCGTTSRNGLLADSMRGFEAIGANLGWKSLGTKTRFWPVSYRVCKCRVREQSFQSVRSQAGAAGTWERVICKGDLRKRRQLALWRAVSFFQLIATLPQQITVEFAIVFGCLFQERRRLLRGVESTFAMRQAIS